MPTDFTATGDASIISVRRTYNLGFAGDGWYGELGQISIPNTTVWTTLTTP